MQVQEKFRQAQDYLRLYWFNCILPVEIHILTCRPKGKIAILNWPLITKLLSLEQALMGIDKKQNSGLEILFLFRS